MVIIFGVPKEHFESVRIGLDAYSDLIAKIGVSKGVLVNVFPGFTEEIPAKFFHLLLKKDLNNPEVTINQLVTSLTKLLEMYVSDPGPNILIFDQDSIS